MKEKLHIGAVIVALTVGVGGRLAKCGKAARFADESVTAARLSDPAMDAARHGDIFDMPVDVVAHGTVAADEASRALDLARLEARLDQVGFGADVGDAALHIADGAQPDVTPEGLASPYTKAGVQAHLTTILGLLDAGQITHLDCDAFPCVAQVTFEATEGDLTSLRSAFSATFQRGPYRHIDTFRVHTAEGDEEGTVDTLSIAMPLFPRVPADMIPRFDARLDDVPQVGAGPL